MRTTVLWLSALLLAATAQAADPPTVPVLLSAGFDSHPPMVQIGTGGAALGEPVSISSGLEAMVLLPGAFATPSLRLRPLSGGSARSARFEFRDSTELTSGPLVLGFTLKAAQLDRFVAYVREQGSSSKNFASLILISSGAIVASDAANAGVVVGNYTAGSELDFEFRFDLDARTWSLYLNGASILSGRNHGIGDRGVGALLLGSDSQTTVGSDWHIDDIYAYRPEQVLADGFE